MKARTHFSTVEIKAGSVSDDFLAALVCEEQSGALACPWSCSDLPVAHGEGSWNLCYIQPDGLAPGVPPLVLGQDDVVVEIFSAFLRRGRFASSRYVLEDPLLRKREILDGFKQKIEVDTAPWLS